MMLILLVR